MIRGNYLNLIKANRTEELINNVNTNADIFSDIFLRDLLHCAIEYGNKEIVCELFIIAPKLRDRNNVGYAAKFGQTDLVFYFAKVDKYSYAAGIAAKYGHRDTVMTLIERRSNWSNVDWSQIMQNAIIGGHPDIIELIRTR